MDRPDRNIDRLKEVHQSDLTEGRINEDFVDWLKTKGVNLLLIVLVGLCAYFGYVRWKQSRISHQTEAWTELANAKLPSSYEDVAVKYPEVDAVPALARIRAASQLLSSVQTGKALGATAGAETPVDPSQPNPPPPPPQADLTAEERTEYLKRADRLYTEITERDDRSPEKALIQFTALTGRATVAESQGDIQQAKDFYIQAAQRAENRYPQLAEQARQRAETVEAQVKPVTLPTRQEVMAAQQRPTTPPVREPAVIDDWARDVLLPKEDGSN